MEIAWHMTKRFLDDFPKGISRKLGRVDKELNSPAPCLKLALSKPDRIYVGDEFCRTRMPDSNELSKFIAVAEKKGLPLTLLTPVLTDQGIEQCKGLFERLKKWDKSTEIVVNDLGVLFFLKKNYPAFQLSMGRLFNKGFKDPRLEMSETRVSEKMSLLLNDCSFNQENIQRFARSLDINAFEQDLLPYADLDGVGTSGLKTCVYLPFGYVTTGRVCFTSGLNQNSDKPFKLNGGCSSPCATQTLVLKRPNMTFKLFQNGNTIFYLYTLSMIRALLEKAKTKKFRLIFQGGLL